MLLIAALGFAALEALALWKKWTRLEYLAKPAVMIVLLLWLWTTTGLGGAALWFGLGILLSLTGDILLMISLDRLFLAGLIAFLLAHLAYLIGFNIPIPEISAWGFVLAIIVGLGGVRVMRRIVAPLTSSGSDADANHHLQRGHFAHAPVRNDEDDRNHMECKCCGAGRRGCVPVLYLRHYSCME